MRKTTLASLCTIFVLLASFVNAVPAMGQAYSTPFITSVTYQNTGTSLATIQFTFYAENSSTTAATYSDTLAANASKSLFVGNVTGISSGFRGSALMSSDQQVVATLVQLPQGSSTVKNRPLSNGLSAGTDTVLIATALENMFDNNTVVSFQNTDSVGADLTVKFYAAGNATAVYTANVTNLPSGAAKYYDLGTMSANLGASFNGSVLATAVKTGTTTPGSIVGSAMELSISSYGDKAFEGVSGGANTVYMPSAMCNAFSDGTSAFNTAYAVQNASLTASASVTVTYSNGGIQTASIPAGSKNSFQTCQATGATMTGLSGSATITSSGAPIVAVGKVSGFATTTAFVGATAGAAKLALPYVRYATAANFAAGTQQRAFIAIQNVGGTTIPANGITITYIDKNGVTVGTPHVITTDVAPGAKVNSNATNAGVTEFGVYPDGSFGGGAIVTGPTGSQLVAVVRIQTMVGSQVMGEDYNGIAVP